MGMDDTPKKKLQLISNLDLTRHSNEKMTISHSAIARPYKPANFISFIWRLRQADVCVLANSGFAEALAVCLAKFTTTKQTKIFFFDILLQNPENFTQLIKSKLLSLLLRSVDYFLCVHKKTDAYEKIYNIPKDKFKYIPFKANNYESLAKYTSSDEGFILSCGQSHRDYGNLIVALAGSHIPLKIVLPGKAISNFHNTSHDALNQAGDNIEIVTHDFEKDSWNHYLAKCSIVVLSINKEAIQPAGISVYLEAMALGKPVIITRGESTEDILLDEQALIVEPSDPTALAIAINKLWSSKDIRDEYAERGKQYALSLKGVDRLVTDILTVATHNK